MDAAALPAGVHQFGNSGFDTFVRVGDAELDAVQTATAQLAEKLALEGLDLGGTDVYAQHLASSVAVDADGDDDGERDDPVMAADLQERGVEPDIGPFTLRRAIEEGVSRARRSLRRAG